MKLSKLLFLLLLFCFDVEGGRDFYKILGIPRNANEDQIKKAYRKLSKKYHPDKNPGDEEAQKRFVEVAAAYEALGDKEKRRVYDQRGEEGLKTAGQPAADPFDLFAQFGFGGHRHQAEEEARGPDIVLDLHVTLEDLYKGKEVEISVRNQVICPKCRGSGAAKEEDVEVCAMCGGKGMRIERKQIGPGFVQQFQTQCPKCGGKGKIIKSTCPYCHGKKVVTGEKVLEAYVEQGMADGATIEFENAADEHPDRQAGHVILKVQTVPHPLFERRGNDLHMTQHISLLEALVGFRKVFRHLDDHEVVIQSSQITKPDEITKVNNEGMPHHTVPSQHGDLYVKFVVDFPQQLSAKQREGFSKIL